MGLLSDRGRENGVGEWPVLSQPEHPLEVGIHALDVTKEVGRGQPLQHRHGFEQIGSNAHRGAEGFIAEEGGKPFRNPFELEAESPHTDASTAATPIAPRCDPFPQSDRGV